MNKLRVFLAALGITVVATAIPSVMDHEGLVLETAPDPIGIPTACFGETGPHIKLGKRYTPEQCRDMLQRRMSAMWSEVSACIKREITVNQGVALLSWTYNVGVGAACKSTLMKRLNRGDPPSSWCPELLRWRFANGRELPGLKKRRKAEMEICLGKSTAH
jgi:lysozyme